MLLVRSDPFASEMSPAAPRPVAEVERLLEGHRQELDRRFPWPAVQAWGVRNFIGEDGRRQGDLAVIAGYVERRNQIPAGDHDLAGVPIEFVVVGPFDEPIRTER
jgi:hypothetical protein